MEPLEEAAPERLAQAEIDAAVSVARRITQNVRRAVEVRPDQRAVVHHVILYGDPLGKSVELNAAARAAGEPDAAR